MVFAANSGTVVDGRVLGARFRAEQRVAEAEHFRRWFVEHGYRVAVAFQFPTQLATDPSVQALALELFTRRIVLP